MLKKVLKVQHNLPPREGAAANPGHAADVAYKRKMQGAAEDCRAQGIVFLPLAAETFGGWHEVAVLQVKKTGFCPSQTQWPR